MGDGPDPAAPERPPVVGVSCSGGGIRAASFALGCLQVLDDHGLLRGPFRARYLSAVSGGSYLVGGLTSIQLSREALGADDPAATLPPFAPGSPEVRRLRNRLGYLTHGPGGLGPELWRVVVGIALNVTALVTLVATVARPVGWLTGLAIPQLRWACGNPSVHDSSLRGCTSTAVPTPPWIVIVGVVLVALSVAIGVWAALQRGGGGPRPWRISASVLALAIGWFALVVVGPQVLGWLHRTRVHVLAHHTVSVAGRHPSWFPGGGIVGLLGGMVAAIAPAWRTLHPKPPAPASAGAATGPVPVAAPPKVPSFVGRFLASHRATLLNLLASIVGPVLIIGLFVVFASRGATAPPGVAGGGSWFEVVRWAWPAALLGVIAWFGDVNGWALHSLYAERLVDAFGIERVASVPPRTPATVPLSPATYPAPASADAIGPADVAVRRSPLLLERAQPVDFPEVLICGTANLSEYGVTPTDQKAASFLLSTASVGGSATGSMATDDYNAASFPDAAGLSLLDAVSISGAAVAPAMGKMTRAPLRFLLALANVRLGVWVPNPTRVQSGASYRGLHRRPGLSYLAREMAGSSPGRSRYVYVSDGGHFDNLGLVELLARRCDWIFTVDASGDAIDTFGTLGCALAIAEAELGITVDIDPEGDMAPTLDAPTFVRSPYSRGVIHYPSRPASPEGPAVPASEGTLLVVKAGVPADAPWDVASYHARYPRFPTDPTSDQLYPAPRFDAYVSLGRFAMRSAYLRWGPDLEVRQGRAVGPALPLAAPSALREPPEMPPA
jgi:hypothetical protein